MLRKRYYANIRQWVAPRADRQTVRARLYAESAKRRKNAVLMAIFYTLGDHFVARGTVATDGSVGPLVNAAFRDLDSVPPNARREIAPLVRLYHRVNRYL